VSLDVRLRSPDRAAGPGETFGHGRARGHETGLQPRMKNLCSRAWQPRLQLPAAKSLQDTYHPPRIWILPGRGRLLRIETRILLRFLRLGEQQVAPAM